MKKFHSIIIIALIVLVVIFATLLLLNRNKFTTNLLLCDKSNGSCQSIAKFNDFKTCERFNEKWGWICEESNPNNIVCRVEEGVISFSYCKLD